MLGLNILPFDVAESKHIIQNKKHSKNNNQIETKVSEKQANLLIALLIFLGVLFWLLAFLFIPLFPASLASSLFVDDVGLSDCVVGVSEDTDVVG